MLVDQALITQDFSVNAPLTPTFDQSSSKTFEAQMFDQLLAHSMSETQKRQEEIKQSLEKLNEDS